MSIFILIKNSFKVIRVLSFEKHRNYQAYPDFDIAIVQTRRIKDVGFVPVCLTSDDTTSLIGDKGKILSWAPQDKTYEIELLSVESPVVKDSYCNKAIGLAIPEHSFCVNQGSNDAWICRGDSGGAFMIQNEKRWFLHGIVSTGVTDSEGNCDIGGSATIFTNVASFYEFVTKS